MQTSRWPIRGITLLPFVLGVSLTAGWLVPVVFELDQKPAARHRHRGLERAAVATMLLTVAACVVVEWWRRREPKQWSALGNDGTVQFGLRGLFLATTGIAGVIAVARLLDSERGSQFIAAAAVVATIGWVICYGGRKQRWRIAILLGATYLPFAWILAFNKPLGHTSGLISFTPIGPGILIAELCRAMTGIARDHTSWIAAFAVVGQLAGGVWLARRGGIPFGIYVSVVLAASAFTSFVVHALYRM